MAGEVTSANVMTRFNALNADLNAKVKNGQMNVKDAQKQVADFRIKHDAEFKAYEATQQGAEAEASDAAKSAMGLTRSADDLQKVKESFQDPLTKVRADEKELAKLNETERKEYEDLFHYTNSKSHGMDPKLDAKIAEWNKNHPTCQVKSFYDEKEKPEMTKMQERLLKQAQHFYPEADVVLDDAGKVVVKDKKTGKIDEAKTKEVQSIKVDGSTSEVTITADKAKPDVKLSVPDQDSVKNMQKYNTKEKAHSEFTNGSEEDVKAAKTAKKDAKKEYKAKDKEVRQLEKEYSKASSSERAALREKLDKARTERDELLKKKEDAQDAYTREKAQASKAGERGIARAARKNEKNYNNVDKLHQVFTNKNEEQEYLKAHPEEKGHTTTLSKKQFQTLDNIRFEANRFIKEAEEKLTQATDEASKKEAQENLDLANKLYGDLAHCMDDGKIDTKKLQAGMMQFTGGDARMNIDEKTQMAKQFDTTRTKITSLGKELGFGNESRTARRLGAAGAAAAATAVATLWSHKKHAHAEDSDYDFQEGESKTAYDFQKETHKYFDQYGNYHETQIIAEATATAKGGSAEAFAHAVADAVAKVPILGQAAAPVIAGVSTFLLCNPQSKDAFNGNSVDHVLSHLDDVSGKDNKKIVAQIQDMKITGDPVRDKAIKAAVIQASLGTGAAKANTEELLAAYQDLKDTQKAISDLENLPDPTKPTEPTPPPVPPKKDPVAVGGWARDHKLLDKHGIPQDQRDHNGVGKDRAQIVIADEDGEIAVTGKDMKEPDTITIKDNTNTKVNTFEYRKLTDEELKNGKTKDGVTLTGLNGQSGPFYVLVSAKDDKGNLKNNHTEVYQLELKVEEDENGDKYTYHLEQYDGMNGSGKSSMQWPNRATRTTRTTNPTRTTGKKKTTNTGKTRTAQQTTDRAKTTPAGGNHGIPYKPIDAWVNMMPSAVPFGQQPLTNLDKIKNAAIAATKDRPMSEEQLQKLNECKTEGQAINYLKSIGINVKYTY